MHYMRSAKLYEVGMKWHTANICAGCWEKKRGERVPVAMIRAESSMCCFCGKINFDGIYVREDAEAIKCRHRRRLARVQ
jgi:hypothetical protein